MATVEIITRVCDMPHAVSDTGAEADSVAVFELYSKASGWYEIDLCRGCAAKIFAPAVANGRKVKAANRKR